MKTTCKTPILEKWFIFGNIVLGYVFNAPPGLREGQHVGTSNYVFLLNDRVVCGDGTEYLLGDPGTKDDHAKLPPGGILKKRSWQNILSWN